MESAEIPQDGEYPWPETIADEDDRLPEGKRFVAHLAITEHYSPRRLTSTTPVESSAGQEDEKISEDETPWARMTTGTSGDDWEG